MERDDILLLPLRNAWSHWLSLHIGDTYGHMTIFYQTFLSCYYCQNKNPWLEMYSILRHGNMLDRCDLPRWLYRMRQDWIDGNNPHFQQKRAIHVEQKDWQCTILCLEQPIIHDWWMEPNIEGANSTKTYYYCQSLMSLKQRNKQQNVNRLTPKLMTFIVK